MVYLKREILKYAEIYNCLPTKLAELDKIPGHDSKVEDGWHRKFFYEFDLVGNVTLKSYGKDGVSGGIGENIDITGVFAARDNSQRWNNIATPLTISPLR
jgi:hypothetical protein